MRATFVLVSSLAQTVPFGVLFAKVTIPKPVQYGPAQVPGPQIRTIGTCSLMAILHFRCKERRRTLRVSITVPITVHGQDESGDKFRVKAKSQSVNRHGALLQLDQPVAVGQMLILVNENSDRTVECRVVSVKRDKENKTYVGVEFISPDSNFWHMSFPLPGAKPLRRAMDSKASA